MSEEYFGLHFYATSLVRAGQVYVLDRIQMLPVDPYARMAALFWLSMQPELDHIARATQRQWQAR